MYLNSPHDVDLKDDSDSSKYQLLNKAIFSLKTKFTTLNFTRIYEVLIGEGKIIKTMRDVKNIEKKKSKMWETTILI